MTTPLVTTSSRRRWARAATLLLLLFAAVPALAATFTVHPVQVVLSGRSRSALLTVRNTSTEGVRFQVSAREWDQSPQGEMILGPTKDVVVFPLLLSLAPGEERNIRVGVTVPPGASEKTYRIFVEELPPAEAPAQAGASVRVLTRVGIPIFLQPAKPVIDGRVEGGTVREGRLAFEVRNTGTIHFMAEKVRVRGLGQTGQTVFAKDLEGWYVLAGKTRLYEIAVPAEHCQTVRALEIDVQTSAKPLATRVATPAGACAPRG